MKLNREERECIIIKYNHWLMNINKKGENTLPNDYNNALINEVLKFINKNKKSVK